jgi:hypothetical protein
MRLVPLLALCLVADLAAAPAPFLKRKLTSEEEAKLILGTWHRVSCTGGSFPPVARPLNDTVVITPGKIVYQPGNFAWQLTLGVENGKKAFDIRKDRSHWTGLYEIDGDTMRMCFTPNPVRPISVTPTKAGEYLQVFKRRPLKGKG